MKKLITRLLLSLSLLTPLPLLAQQPQPTEADITAAKTLFEQAQGLYEQKNFTAALDSYQKAYNIVAKPTILFNIAQCQRQLEMNADAVTSYKKFLVDDPATPYKAEVEFNIASLDDKVGNKKEALDYYQRYLQEPPIDASTPDPNRPEVEKRVAELPKEIADQEASKPVEKPKGIKFVLPGVLLGGSVVLDVVSLTIKSTLSEQAKNPDFNNADCKEDPTLTLCQTRKNLRIASVSADTLLVGAGVTLALALLKKDEASAPTAFHLVPTRDGALVTFTYELGKATTSTKQK